ncbi:TolC family protein [Acidocella sp.]|uniref:TolC family protein n=1 Tax=Acidocella sp. TaxID=50710 RepID=UPI003CFED269
MMLAVLLAGCASYHAVPLAVAPDLQSGLSGLQTKLPDGRGLKVSAPLDLQTLVALAVLNDPDLVAARAQHGVAKAVLLAAGMPPDPSITGGFASLLSGPGLMPALNGAFTQDLGALITGPADRAAARAGLHQTDEDILWQEWQVATKAEQLAVSLTADNAILASLRQDEQLLSTINQQTQTQIAAQNLTSTEGVAALSALASVQSSEASTAQTARQDQQALDALLGLQPDVTITLAALDVSAPAPDAVKAALASLPVRRPDLLALRYGYEQADQKLRAAILGQFLPLSLGAAGGRDTSNVWSFGPQFTLTLPLFNRNRPAIAAAKASRAALRAQYQAALDNAAGAASALPGQINLLQSQLQTAQLQAAQARSMAQSAAWAYRAGQLAGPAYANLAVVAGERERSVIALRAQLQNAELSLASLLGFGLPPALPEHPAS